MIVTGRQRRQVQLQAAAATLAEQLRVRRDELGLTRPELADQAGISPATLAKLEQQQTREPGFFIVAALAEVLGLDLQRLAAAAAASRQGAIRPAATAVSIGYEGRDQASVLDELVARGVQVLADVRLNAVSRRPGFSKTSLSTALQSVGIEYRHFPGLGNPQDNRAPFRSGRVEQGRAAFGRRLDDPAPAAELAELADVARSQATAVLCVERDERRCHRQVILERMLTSGLG